MESNGKSVDKLGNKMTKKTAAVVWGAEGTNAQHSFFQLLHQGTSVIPCDFLIAAVSDEEFAGHQEVLLANCLAQSRALMTGRNLKATTKKAIAGFQIKILTVLRHIVHSQEIALQQCFYSNN